jgi:hypothetical protein
MNVKASTNQILIKAHFIIRIPRVVLYDANDLSCQGLHRAKSPIKLLRIAFWNEKQQIM